MSGNSGIVVDPAFVEVTLQQPQQEKQIIISYTNNTNSSLRLEFFALDFRQKDELGTLSFLGAESKSFSYSLSSFLQFETNTMTLAPKEKQNLRIYVTNRPDLSPGGHYAAVVAKEIDNGQVQNGQTQVSPAISALIFLRKEGGERFNLSLNNMNWPESWLVFSHPKDIVLTFQNEGNIHLVPYGRVEIRDWSGRLTYKGVINTSSLRVFPETRRQIKVDMQQQAWNLPVTIEQISVSGSDSLNKTKFLSQQSYLFIDPLLLIFFAIIILWLAIRWKRKRPAKKG